MKAFCYRVLDWVWFCYTFVYADAAGPNMEIPPITEEVGFTSLRRCASFWRVQSCTFLRTASLLVSTAKNPLVNNCVNLFSNTSSLDSSRFGEFWASLEVCWNHCRIRCRLECDPVVGWRGLGVWYLAAHICWRSWLYSRCICLQIKIRLYLNWVFVQVRI